MYYALYRDPSVADVADFATLTGAPAISYLRLTDLPIDQISHVNPDPQADYTIVELHPAQWEHLKIFADRLSFVLGKSDFDNLTSLKSRLANVECDITFTWDHRFHVSYYFKMLQYWMFCGINHVSFYELTDFAKWQRLQQFLNENGFYFYDRFHACRPGHESKYQKHMVRFGNLIAQGGWSRVTQDGKTRTRAPKTTEWVTLSDEDAWAERMLFAFADRDGVALEDLRGLTVDRAVESGLAVIENGRLCPTDQGLWDTVRLVSQLQQV